MTLLTAQVETLADQIDTLKPLLPLHWEELALYKDRMPLDPDYAWYLRTEEEGRLLLVTLRADGEPVGYFVGTLGASPHYRSTPACKMDILYVHPDHRGASAGLLLLRTIRRELKRRGIKIWWMGSKNHKSIERLFERYGFDRAETHFSMWIGGDGDA